MRLVMLAGLIALPFALIEPSLAQSPFPTMTGTWSGNLDIIAKGKPSVHDPKANPNAPAQYRKDATTLTVSAQNERSFQGQVKNGQGTSFVVGIMAHDLHQIVITGPEFHLTARLTDPNTLDGCGSARNDQGFASYCIVLKRQNP
jgi:hypothetical protein